MNLEKYKKKLEELKKVRSDACKGHWQSDFCGDIWSTAKPNPQQIQNEEGLYQVFYTTTSGPDPGDATFIAMAANEWEKLISDLESCVEALEYYQSEETIGVNYSYAKDPDEVYKFLLSHKTEIASKALANLKLGVVE